MSNSEIPNNKNNSSRQSQELTGVKLGISRYYENQSNELYGANPEGRVLPTQTRTNLEEFVSEIDTVRNRTLDSSSGTHGTNRWAT